MKVGLGLLVVVVALLGIAVLQTRREPAESPENAQKREAISRVQSARVPIAPLLQLFGLGGSGGGTWKELVEAAARKVSGSADGYDWTGDNKRSGLLPYEWLVGFEKGTTGGWYWLVQLPSGSVIFLHDDPVAARRVGKLRESPTPTLRVAISYVGLTRCEPGWCFDVAGTAENLGPPIIDVDAEAKLIMTVGEKTITGDSWWGQTKDRLRAVSAKNPWPTGDRRSFEYLSDRIPDVYAAQAATAVGFLEISTETTSRGKLREFYVVRDVPWPPR